MRFIALLCSLVVASAAHAAPAEAPNETGKFLADQPVFQHLQLAGQQLQQAGQQLQQVGQTASTKASELVVNALGFLGVPYRRGGTSADTGFDCSGFVKTVYQDTMGLVLPRVAAQQAADTEKIARADLKPGDLVFFNTMRRAFSHVGIYIGDGKFVHAPRTGEQVRIESLSVAYWTKRFSGARRVLTGSEDTPLPQASSLIEPLVR